MAEFVACLLAWELLPATARRRSEAYWAISFDLSFLGKWGLADQIPFYSIVTGILCFFAPPRHTRGRLDGDRHAIAIRIGYGLAS